MLEQMRLELEVEGHVVHFAAINGVGEVPDQQELVNRCAFPLFQDTVEVGAWGVHGGAKDDLYVYDSTGHLHAFLSPDGEVPTNLSTDAGYAAVKEAILAAP